MISCIRTVEPQKSAVAREDVKRHLRVLSNDQDAEIDWLIQAATQYAEDHQWAQLITATWQEKFDGLFPPDGFRLRRNPVQSAVVTYIDTNNQTQTLDASTVYTLDTATRPARIYRQYLQWWPVTRNWASDITITYVAGYGDDPANVPINIRQAILLICGHWWLNREAVAQGSFADVPKSAEALLAMNSFRNFF